MLKNIKPGDWVTVKVDLCSCGPLPMKIKRVHTPTFYGEFTFGRSCECAYLKNKVQLYHLSLIQAVITDPLKIKLLEYEMVVSRKYL